MDNHKTNKVLLIIAIILGIGNLVLDAIDFVILLPDSIFYDLFYFAFLGLGLRMVILYSELYRLKLYLFFRQLFGSFLILGALFKIMHWPWANEILESTVTLIPLTYLVRFFVKKKYGITDVLKVLLVFSISAKFLIHLMHYPYGVFAHYATTISLLLTVLSVAREVWNDQQFMEEEKSVEEEVAELVDELNQKREEKEF